MRHSCTPEEICDDRCESRETQSELSSTVQGNECVRENGRNNMYVRVFQRRITSPLRTQMSPSRFTTVVISRVYLLIFRPATVHELNR